jgi:prophage maintenance system killer protein
VSIGPSERPRRTALLGIVTNSGERVRVRDRAVLDAACRTAAGASDITTGAAALLLAIVTGLPLETGNERLAFDVARTYLAVHGPHVGRVDPVAADDLVRQVAQGQLIEVTAIGKRLLALWRAQPLRPGTSPGAGHSQPVRR